MLRIQQNLSRETLLHQEELTRREIQEEIERNRRERDLLANDLQEIQRQLGLLN